MSGPSIEDQLRETQDALARLTSDVQALTRVPPVTVRWWTDAEILLACHDILANIHFIAIACDRADGRFGGALSTYSADAVDFTGVLTFVACHAFLSRRACRVGTGMSEFCVCVFRVLTGVALRCSSIVPDVSVMVYRVRGSGADTLIGNVTFTTLRGRARNAWSYALRYVWNPAPFVQRLPPPALTSQSRKN